jgi:hypothetical protein
MSKEKDPTMTIENGETSEYYNIARQAVRSALGTDNEYLQRLLSQQLEGVHKKYKSASLKEIIRPADRENIKKELAQSIEVAKSTAVGVLKEQLNMKETGLSATGTPLDASNIQAISNWIMNTVREVREQSDKWKTINGVLATVLPIVIPVITGFIQYYITRGGNCSAGSG